MNLKDALTLKNYTVNIDGVEVTLRRPSLADLAETMNIAADDTKQKSITAWLVFNHLLDDKGDQYFTDIEKVYKCDAVFVEKIAKEVDKLYSEGSSLPAQQ